MDQLRQQWINLMRLDHEASPSLLKFRKALSNEWSRRAHLAKSRDDYFKWPSTRGGLGGSRLNFDGWNQEGMLKFLGYQVGTTQGETDTTRRRILDAIFSENLPPVNGPDYLAGWGKARTPDRLKRLANEIARFARHAKSRGSVDMTAAIDDWETDLNYLYHTYYIRKFRFAWPSLI